ncbi:MAG: TSUP family transporter [Terriglobales bacterium]
MWIVWGVLAGIAVGILSGLLGLAGGVVLIPLLLYGFKMNQKLAQGTSLAILLPPTGILAFIQYYRRGEADLRLGLVIAAGIVLGGWLGGAWVQYISGPVLRKIFAALLVAVAVKMFLEK